MADDVIGRQRMQHLEATNDNTDFQDQKDELMVIESIYSDRPEQFHFLTTPDGPNRRVRGSVDVHLPKLDSTVILIATNSNESKKKQEVKYLPPVRLTFDFPSDYPSSSAPKFAIEAMWMDTDTRVRLCDRLMESWEENKGMPILFTWIQLLEEEALADVLSRGFVDLDAIATDAGKQDLAFFVASDALKKISEYEEGAMQSDFEKNWYDCEVCFDSKSGRDSFRFLPCGHIFCSDCVSGFYRQKLKDSTVKRLECLTEGCDSPATEAQLRRALGEEEFERYDRLLLEGTLFLMTDVVTCPRESCQAPVLTDSGEGGTSSTPTLGRCAVCQYTFCVLCRKTYHGLEPCAIDSKLRRKLLDEYADASQAEREKMYKRFGGRKLLEGQIEALKSMNWIDSNSKPCPKCRVNIEKKDGCNKMRCSSCNVNFCWLCGQMLPAKFAYDHFNVPSSSKCFNRLFEGIEDEEDDEDEDDLELDLQLSDEDTDGTEAILDDVDGLPMAIVNVNLPLARFG